VTRQRCAPCWIRVVAPP